MAYPTAVNSQITDSIAQVNAEVLGVAPAMSMGELYQATSQALSNAAHNATTNQLNANVTGLAATAQGAATVLSVDNASDGVATVRIFR